MKSIFNTAERNLVYTQALSILTDYSPYMCDCIDHVCEENNMKKHDHYDLEWIRENFPEFTAKRPEGRDYMWFDKEDRMSRVALLQQCIEETKEY